MRPLRVAIFHTSLPAHDRKIGGVEAAVHRLANSFADDSAVDVTVLSCDRKPAGAAYGYRRIFPFAMKSRLARLILLPLLLNFLDLRGYDVVHTHGDDWFWFRRRRPTVRTMHGSALREAQTATRWPRKLLQYCVYPLEHLSTRLATCSVAVGRETKQLYGCDRIVGNGVDLSRFEAGAKSPSPMIVFIGLWDGRKRGKFAFDMFIEHVLPHYPDSRLHMVSDRTEPHPNVVLHEHPDDAQLAALLSQAWVFCYPSVYEGFGIPYVEAMASGTAIISSPNAGADEVLDDGTYGVISGDAEFGSQLLCLLDDAEKRKKFEAAGLRRSQHYSAKTIAARYLQIYRDVAQQC